MSDLVKRLRAYKEPAPLRHDIAEAAATIEAQAAEIERLQRDCAEAYQVVGTLAGPHGDLFEHPQVIKALDNLSAASHPSGPRPHDDLLPFTPVEIGDPLLAAEARAEQAESALAKAVEVMRGILIDAPESKPEPHYDDFGYFSDDYGDLYQRGCERTHWFIAENIRAFIQNHQPEVSK